LNGPLDGRAYSKVYKRAYKVTSVAPQIQDVGYFVHYGSDTLFLTDGFGACFVSDFMPLSSILGITDHLWEHHLSNVHFTPPPANSKWSGDTDWSRYGSPLSGLATIGRQDIDPSVIFREKDVNHTRYVGVVGDKDPTYFFSPWESHGVGYFGSFQRLKRDYIRNVAQATGVNSLGFLTFGIGLNNPSVRSDMYADAYDMTMHDYNIASNSGVPVRTEGQWTFRYSDFDNHSFRNGNHCHIDISYRYQMTWAEWAFGDDRWSAFYRVHLILDTFFGNSFGNLPAFQQNVIPDDIFTMINSSVVSLDGIQGTGWNYGYDIGAGINFDTILPPEFYSDSYQIDAEGLGKFLDYRKNGTNNPLAKSSEADNLVDGNMFDLRPSSFLAASDAFDKYLTVLQGSNLQTLVKLPGILELLPDLGPLMETLAKASRGDVSAVKDLIDLLTKLILQYQFTVRPLQKLADQISDKDISSMLQALTHSRTAVIYGGFHYTFTDNENFFHDGSLVLDTQAKVKVHFDISTSMALMLSANSLGILPTLSRLWSLVPFSFVIDWFTNMSKRLHLVDNQITFATFGISWCLYSYKLTYYPSPEALSTFGLKSYLDDKPFGISVYRRELSRLMPRLRDSKFDFLRPTSRPDSLTVGALIWQLFS
jgi:hypothetical protein